MHFEKEIDENAPGNPFSDDLEFEPNTLEK
jgi:hypothetical protein